MRIAVERPIHRPRTQLAVSTVLPLLAISLASVTVSSFAAEQPASKARTMGEILQVSTAADWRSPEPENTLYLQLATGRVVIELAPIFAPEHAANIRTLVRQKYFDGLSINRAQDNFVVQWGDADGNRP